MSPRHHCPFPSIRPPIAAAAAFAVLASASSPPASAGPAACSADSPGHAVALVELYTSEGCSSCPPAERWLGGLPAPGVGLDRAVPLAFHVPYWDYLGWKDPLAQAAFAGRHAALLRWNRRGTAYTPHFFVSGDEVANAAERLAAAIRATNARPAGVRLALELGRQGAATLSVAATAALDRPRADARLFVAVVETPIVAPIGAGENAGRILTHAHVVRRLLGPIELPAGKASSRWTLPIEPGWTANRLGVAAFVQDQGSGEVLQALARPPCPEG